MVAYDYSQTYSKIYSTPFRTMVATLPTTLDGNISYAENWDSRKKSENSLTEGLTRNTQITTNASLNYANTFGKHNVSAILLMETYSNDGNNFSAYGEGFSIKELAELKYASIPDKMSINGMSSVARKAGSRPVSITIMPISILSNCRAGMMAVICSAVWLMENAGLLSLPHRSVGEYLMSLGSIPKRSTT